MRELISRLRAVHGLPCRACMLHLVYLVRQKSWHARSLFCVLVSVVGLNINEARYLIKVCTLLHALHVSGFGPMQFLLKVFRLIEVKQGILKLP